MTTAVTILGLYILITCLLHRGYQQGIESGKIPNSIQHVAFATFGWPLWFVTDLTKCVLIILQTTTAIVLVSLYGAYGYWKDIWASCRW